jgi:hypothetical protein
MKVTKLAAIEDIVRQAAKAAKNREQMRRCRDFAASLYFLAQNWKPCLLFDFGTADNELLLTIRNVGVKVIPVLFLYFLPFFFSF